jgi:mannose-6-phosphate isomerase
MSNGLYRIEGQIQNYAWGGIDYIPKLLGVEPKPQTPYAEYWLGAHPKAPAHVVMEDNSRIPLNELIEREPRRLLGSQRGSPVAQLPYLLKVLDVREPLSIQVHPTKPQAEAGYRREMDLGIPLDAPERNYRDRNHKPELMVALDDFWLLHGFLPYDKLAQVLDNVAEFHPLRRVFEESGYEGLYKHVMTMPRESVHAILHPLVRRLQTTNDNRCLSRSSPDYWTVKTMSNDGEDAYDRGVFSLYFMNLLKLSEGQAIFQDAGIPHAYLLGQNIELMANSDNVLRGGLTVKHVDVPELLRTIRFEGIQPGVITGTQSENPFEIDYECPVRDFRLSQIRLAQGDEYTKTSQSMEILLVLDGEGAAASEDKRLALCRGQSAVLFSETEYRIEAFSETMRIFRASLP